MQHPHAAAPSLPSSLGVLNTSKWGCQIRVGTGALGKPCGHEDLYCHLKVCVFFVLFYKIWSLSSSRLSCQVLLLSAPFIFLSHTCHLSTSSTLLPRFQEKQAGFGSFPHCLPLPWDLTAWQLWIREDQGSGGPAEPQPSARLSKE